MSCPTPHHQALFEEGSGGAARAPENRLANFLRVSVTGAGEEEGAEEDSSVMESDEEGEGGGLW